MRLRAVIMIVAAPLVLAACSDDPLPTEGEQGHEAAATEDLSVDLTISPDHVHMLSEVTFTALVTDHHGDALTDFDSLVVGRKAHDSNTWRATALELDGESWVGSLTFTSSGDYEIHVVESEGAQSAHAAAEADAGVYEADHTFGSAGDATVEIHFTGSGGGEAATEFHIHIAHAHE